jgi:hypothetical protein
LGLFCLFKGKLKTSSMSLGNRSLAHAKGYDSSNVR